MTNPLPAWLFEHQALIPSPCFVIDAGQLRENARILDAIQQATHAKILLALKGYAAFPTFSLLSRDQSGPLSGTCASSVDEARLGKEEFGGELHAFAAGWTEDEIRELTKYADHITFNSLNQWRKFRPLIQQANSTRKTPIKCGFRVNPEHSEGTVPLYDPCHPSSRLGIRAAELALATPEDWQGITGLHFHTLCEQDAPALVRTLNVFEHKFAPYLSKCQWLNWGGGHHITRKDYQIDLLISTLLDWQKKYPHQIYLEPGEAVALNAGWLVATILDLVVADMKIAILDVSAACHMPDVLEMPYTPHVWYWNGHGTSMACPPNLASNTNYRLAGKSCLAGDVIGEYDFVHELSIGQRLAFADMAIYSMVKTTTFNGLRLPSIALFDPQIKPHLRILRNFNYEDFKNRLG